MKIKLLATLVFLSFYFHITAQNSAVTVYDLKSEYLTNPIGLDTKKPRFTWKIKDQRRGAVQNAYQITVGDRLRKSGLRSRVTLENPKD